MLLFASKEINLPRYTYSLTYSNGIPSISIILRFVGLFVMILVLEAFMCKPTFLLSVSRLFKITSKPVADSLKMAISSANLRCDSHLFDIIIPLFFQLIFLKVLSRVAINSFGERGSPYLTPLSILHSSPCVSSFTLLVFFE